MELQKNGVAEKSFLGVLVFGHPYCSSKDSTKFNAEHKNICQFSCHIGSNIPAFSIFFLFMNYMYVFGMLSMILNIDLFACL